MTRLSSTTHLLPGSPPRLRASLKLEGGSQVDVYQRSRSIIFVDNHKYDWFTLIRAIIVWGRSLYCARNSVDVDLNTTARLKWTASEV